MPPANPHGKPELEIFERQRATMQELLKTIRDLLAPVIAEIDAEGIRLKKQADEFEQAERRGEIPDPHEVARMVAAQDALVQRCEKLNVHMVAMGQQAEAVTHAAEACLFEELCRQFNAQFNTKEGL